MPLIDFSKITLKGISSKAKGATTPTKGRKIDFSAIKQPAITRYVTEAPLRPVATPKVPAAAVPSASFIGRPLVTPFEQQRMKAAAPKPTSRLSLWVNGKTVEQRTQEGKQMTAALAGKSLFDGFKEGVDSYNNATAKGFMGSAAPAQGGITGNRWVDLAGSLATMGAVIQTGVQVVGGLVSAINFTRAMNSKWNWPTVEGRTVTRDIAVRVAQANPNMDEGTTSSIADLVARTGGNPAQLNALASNTSTLSRSLNQISLASQNPTTMATNVIPSAARAIAQTGIFQAIPMPSGLVHSTAPAIPMGTGALPAPTKAVAPAVSVAPKATQPAVATRLAVPKIIAKSGQVPAFTTPAAIDKTIPAIDVKKANLVDVTGKVDLKTIQANLPTANRVVVDTKRQTVMFMHDTAPLDAMGIDRPQLRDWYGIDGAKLLREVTQPAPIVQPAVAQIAPTLSKMETTYPRVIGEMVDGRIVRKDIPNQDSIDATIDHPTILHGIREIPMSMFDAPPVINKKTTALADAIRESGEINPLIVAVDKNGPYILEGANRYDALKILGAKSIPAMVVLDNDALASPSLSTTPQKGTATTISNQKTSISTSPPVSLQGEAKTGASAVIPAVKGKKVAFKVPDGSDRVDGKVLVGDVLSIPELSDFAIAAVKDNEGWHAYELTSGYSLMTDSMGIVKTRKALGELIVQQLDRVKFDFEASPADALLRMVSPTKTVNPEYSRPTRLMTSTSAPAAAPSIGNATPARGLIDYSKIELNGTTSVTSPAVLKSVSNTGKGFDNYIQNTAGTKDTSLSGLEKFKEGRDLQVRRYENQFDGLMKTPAGAEWMTMAIEADEVLREEYTHPFYIDEGGNKVVVDGEFAPAILNRYLKQYGPNFGKFLQHLQRAGIPDENFSGLDADKAKLARTHKMDAITSLVNFQKNEPQLYLDYTAAAQELGKANTLLPEFYKQFLSPETYANEKAHPNYYVSLSAGRTEIFDRDSIAPLERTHGLTDLEHVVDPLPGLLAVYRDAIRAQGINNAKREAVRSNKNSEVATTVLSDSIVHLKENGVDRAYDVHDTNVTKSVKNLTLSKQEVPTWEKWLVRAPTTALRFFATGLNPAFGLYNIIRDNIQGVGTTPLTPKGLVKGAIRAVKSPGLSQWFDSYRDPMMSKGTRAIEALKVVESIITYPNEIGEALTRSVVAESILDRGGTYLDQLHGYFASTGFFALHGTFFNDFIASNIPFTRATIAVMRSAYRNTFYGLPIGDKGGTFSGKQGAEKLAGRNLATIIFTIISALAIKEAGREKEYKLLRDRASYFYFPIPNGAFVKLPVPIGFQPIKAATDYVLGYKSDPMDVARQTVAVLPGMENFFLPPAFALFLQYKFNLNFFTGAAVTAAVGTPPANPLEAALMKTGMDEGQASFLVRAFLADIPSQVQYVFDMVGTGSSAQASPLTKRFIVKDPTTSSNAAVDDFYALIDAASRSSNPALKHYVNARASAIGQLLHNAKLYPADAKIYTTTATDNILATFATIAENPTDYGIKKFGPFSWRPKGNYEELTP